MSPSTAVSSYKRTNEYHFRFIQINHQGSVSSELGIKFQRETLDHYMPQNSSAAMHKTLSSSHRFKGGA